MTKNENEDDFLAEELEQDKRVDTQAQELADTTFEGQEEDEDIILILKRHPIVLYKLIIILAVGLVLVITSFAIFGASLYSSLVTLIYLVFGGYHLFKDLYTRSSSSYIITTNRVISVDQNGLFHRVVSEAPINIIMNVSYETKGAYQTLFNYGQVNILTSGKGEPDVIFKDVPHPYSVQQKITSLMLGDSGKSEEPQPKAKIEPNKTNVLR